jgi:acyl-CoA dehydrogenase
MKTTADPALTGMLESFFEAWEQHARGRAFDTALDRDLWREMRRLGLTDIASATSSGGTLRDTAGVLYAAARHAAPVPLAEHDLLAGFLAAHAGIPPSDGPAVACVVTPDGDARMVPWARHAKDFLVVWPVADEWRVAAIPSDGVTVIKRSNDISGRPRDDIRIDLSRQPGTRVSAESVARLRLRGALARAVQIAGALDRCVDLTVRYANDRRQFGRPIAAFQAVTHLAADAAAEQMLARGAAFEAVAVMCDPDATYAQCVLPVAVAKSVAGHAATRVIRNAHQVHGAIGTTLEYPLQLFTRAALAWQSEFGSATFWDAQIADMVLASDQPAWRVMVPA